MANQLPSHATKKGHVLMQIEAKVQTLLQSLHDEQPLLVKLRTHRSTSSTTQLNRSNYCFPGKYPQAAWRFTVVLKILDIIHKAVADDNTISKRDVYYQDPELFGSQAIVDKYVDKLASTFNVSREDLNVTAEVRGLIAGAILDGSKEPLQSNSIYMDPEGLPVPRSSQLQHLLVSSNSGPRFLLLIEKRATFHALSRSNFHVRHNCVLLTGQGYPDLATRAFLYHFHYSMAPEVPCYALVDFDPDGLSIYNVYTRGSQALSHESNVSVPGLHLLGLTSEDALLLLNMEDGQAVPGVNSQDKRASQAEEKGNDLGLVYLSRYERGRAKGLLKRLMSSGCHREEDEAKQKYIQEKWNWQESKQQALTRQETKSLIRELQVCLIMGYKVETQILDRRPGGLEGWILEKVANSV